jgi:hypothetical protein
VLNLLIAAGDKTTVRKTSKFSKNAGLGHRENNLVMHWVILISDRLEYNLHSPEN